MLLNILFIIGGIILVLWGADRLTDGAVGIAERMNIPQLIIGLTIVAMGTSMPEFCVSLVSAIKGTPDMAVGNVIGSNIFNTLLIVGVAALVTPITILRNTVRKDIPFAMLASVWLIVLCYNGNLSRLDSVTLLLLFIVFMYITLKGAKENEKKGEREQGNEESLSSGSSPEDTNLAPPLPSSPTPLWKSIGLIVLGLACLIGGSNIFVEGATYVATTFGISDAIIGLTVVAMGTSLPELATTVVAARKGNSGIAIGNVLGSNVFNILMVLGLTGFISPMQISGITLVDYTILIGSLAMLWLFSFTKLTIQRWEGAALTAVFLTYLVWLIWQI